MGSLGPWATFTLKDFYFLIIFYFFKRFKQETFNQCIWKTLNNFLQLEFQLPVSVFNVQVYGKILFNLHWLTLPSWGSMFECAVCAAKTMSQQNLIISEINIQFSTLGWLVISLPCDALLGGSFRSRKIFLWRFNFSKVDYHVAGPDLDKTGYGLV